VTDRNEGETLRALADLEAIRDLARRYAHCVWQKDAEGASVLFTEDAEMDTGDRAPIVGRQAIYDSYSEILQTSTLRPFVHNHVIELDGDRATGTCYLDLRGVAEGQPMTGYGHYVDHYVREADGWKFGRRQLEIEVWGEV